MESTTMQFFDAETGDEGVAIVRVLAGCIGLALSLRNDGDIEVFLSRQDCENLASALQQAAVETPSGDDTR